MQQFRTHTGEIVQGERLQAACDAVAQWYEENARAIRADIGGHYAAHVTEATKDKRFYEGMQWADDVRHMRNLHNFSVWQRVNAELTGECVGLLP